MRQSAGPPESRFRLIDASSGGGQDGLAEAVLHGLTRGPKSLPCRFFYDATGSQLFEQICELPEYYLTRAEHEILERRAGEIAALAGGPVALAELGSGNARKTRLLIQALLRRAGRLRYLPIDVSREILEESSRQLALHHPELHITAIAGDYAAGLQCVAREEERPLLLCWLGSTIGNLSRSEAAEFLAGVRKALLPGDHLLLGIDLRKPRADLERAYDDDAGVTARFNLNLLSRINRELGGDFDLSGFRHQAVYDEREGRIRMYLVSRRAQRVRVAALELELYFADGEAIHTEDSVKYDLPEISELARRSGFRVAERWLDAAERFSLSLFAPERGAP